MRYKYFTDFLLRVFEVHSDEKVTKIQTFVTFFVDSILKVKFFLQSN